MYTTIFTVRGSGQFPVDMLRYDGCFPSSQDDVAFAFTQRDERSVTLVSYTSMKQTRVTPARWESFGWKVVKLEKPRKF